MGIPAVTAANESQRHAAISAIALAFSEDPLARWALPNPADYLEGMPAFIDAFGGNGLAQGGTYIVAEGKGAAMWLPPGVAPDEERMGSLMETTNAMDSRHLASSR